MHPPGRLSWTGRTVLLAYLLSVVPWYYVVHEYQYTIVTSSLHKTRRASRWGKMFAVDTTISSSSSSSFFCLVLPLVLLCLVSPPATLPLEALLLRCAELPVALCDEVLLRLLFLGEKYFELLRTLWER